MPAEMTNSLDIIKKCVESSESDCLGECNWFKGTAEEQQPTQETHHCVTKEEVRTSTYSATTDNCMNLKQETECANLPVKCVWKPIDETTTPVDPVNPVDPADPNDPIEPTTPTDGPTPLFSKDFCHPATLDTSSAEQDFATCLTLDKDLCVAPCMFSNGKSLIPDSDFCAPEDLTDDVQQIMSCISA